MRGALDVEEDELAAALDAVRNAAQRYFSTGGDGAIVPAQFNASALKLDEPLPEQGLGLTCSTEHLINQFLPWTTRTASPSFMGLITTGGNPYSLVADMLATSLNQHVTRGLVSPLGAAVEAQVVRWIAEFIRYPSSSGALASGGSVANLTALGAARAVRHGRQGSSASFTAYASDQSHFSVARACDVLGFAPLRSVRSTDDFRIDAEALCDAIEKDRKAGLTPLAVIANAGTVFTGAVDDLTMLADICEREGLWLHADAAYGGPAAGTELARSLFQGLERADSVAVDAHKWLFVPYEAGCVLVRDPASLEKTYRYSASYTAPSSGAAVDFMDLGLQMSRDFKALKIWSLFAGAGAQAIREAIEANISLMREFASELAADDRFELLADTPLSIVCFRPRGLSNPGLDCQAIVNELQRRGRVFITIADCKGETALRACCVNHRATREHTDLLRDEIVAVTRDLKVSTRFS